MPSHSKTKFGKTGRRKKRATCGVDHKVILPTELDAKIALATRIHLDKGEKRYYACYFGGKKHWHLTSQDADPGRKDRSASGN